MHPQSIARRRFFLSLSATAVIAAGCASAGNKFDMSKVDQLKPGVTTMTEATQLLGKPQSTSTYGNGQQLVQWRYIQSGFAGSNLQSEAAVVLFDKDGVMVRLVEKTQSGR